MANTTESERERCSVRRGDIFLTRTSETVDELGMSCVALRDYPGATFNGFAKRLRLKDKKIKIHPEFMAYYLRSLYFRKQVDSMAVMTTRASLNNEMIARLFIDLPTFEMQIQIANALKCLDDKIKVNNQINKNLELTAKAIFKEWFIDFGPVKAKADGNRPFGIDDEAQALFTSEFQESPYGPIPKGWKSGTYNLIFKERTERIKNISTKPTVLSAVATSELVPSAEHFNKKVFSDDIGNYKVVYKNDFAYNPSRINIGSIGKLDKDIIGAVSPIYLVVTPYEHFHNFNFFHLKLPQTREYIKQYSSGSVRQALTITHFLDLPVIAPPIELILKFNQIYDVLNNSINSNLSEIKILKLTRDNLLPRLLSGELNLENV